MKLNESHAFIIIFSIIDAKTFNYIPSLIERIERIKDQSFEAIPSVFVGNKCDLENERQVNTKQGQILSQKYNKTYVETSFKLGMNGGVPLNEVLDHCVKSTLIDPSIKNISKKKVIKVTVIGSYQVGKSKFELGISLGQGYTISQAIFPRDSSKRTKLIYTSLSFLEPSPFKKKVPSVFKKGKKIKLYFEKITKSYKLPFIYTINFSKLITCCILGNIIFSIFSKIIFLKKKMKQVIPFIGNFQKNFSKL